jgi:AAA family ATP:ADP antiporter
MSSVAFRPPSDQKSPLDRLLSLFTDVRAGEGATAALMLFNVFLLLICYSVIKTVREPLILMGGGAEVRSYAAAGQAILLMGFVPLYGWFASRVDRVKLLVGVTLFFVINIELFALAVAARTPFIGVAFFIWVGIFNVSLVAQFWSYANDIYDKPAGDRLFPLIMIGMTAGAPIGSFVAGRLFGVGFTPQAIMQISAILLSATLALYLVINRRQPRHARAEAPLAASGGFQLVFRSPYLRAIAMLIVLLNIVNTTGEYLIARLLTAHATTMAAANPGFNEQAYLGSFAGSYQFWVNVAAFLLQAFVVSRLVKYAGLRGALLALPFIALGGYATIAAGAGFAVVRWIKTAENATDYSIMNTARQLLWLPTTREEKYKAKQAIDTFFTRGGDVLSAVVVYVGTTAMQLPVAGFAACNVVLTLVWIGLALRILKLHEAKVRLARVAAVIAVAALVMGLASATAHAQQTREEEKAAAQSEKAQHLQPYQATTAEKRLKKVEDILNNKPHFYPFIGSVYPGGWLAAGPGYRTNFAETGHFDLHGAWSVKNYRRADATLTFPDFAGGHLGADVQTTWFKAPKVAFYGVGNASRSAELTHFDLQTARFGGALHLRPGRFFTLTGGADYFDIQTGPGQSGISIEQRFTLENTAGLLTNPTYFRTRASAEFDWRESPGYTRRGGLYRAEWLNYDQRNTGRVSFSRVDGEVDQFIPLLRENWVIALRAVTSTTTTTGDNQVPYYLMPDLGGSDLLRGYPTWRFRDRNRILLSGEYRWMAGQFVDMALFVDAGKVTPRWGDIDLSGLKKTYGIGIRFHTPNATMMRFEVARTSDEGIGLIFAFGPSF